MSKNKKPFPFEVCKECCEGGGTGGTVDQVQGDWNQSDATKVDHIKNRTHYSESVLLCDYTHTLDMENWEGEDYGGTFTLDKEVEPDSLRLYINGEYVPVKYRTVDNIDYAFYIDAQENDIFTYNKSDNSIVFFPWIVKANYQLYEETVYQLDEKYIPDSIARKEYVDTLVLKGNKSGEIVSLADISSVKHNLKVKLSSKNLIPYPYFETSKTVNGITFTVNEDRSITANGTATAQATFYIAQNKKYLILPNTKYRLSGCEGGAYNTYRMRVSDGKTTAIESYTKEGKTFSYADTSTISMLIIVSPGVTMDNVVFKPQLELGTTATPYTPFVPDVSAATLIRDGVYETDVQEYTPNADGTVEGVTSIYPSTTLSTNTPGVLIECEYNRDINKAFTELQNAIISLGGNV